MAKTSLPGYVRGGPFSRGYISPSGVALSYRDYRKAVTEAGAVKPLSPTALKISRAKRAEFQDIVNTMTKVKRRSLETQLDIARTRKRVDNAEIAQIQKQLKTVKKSVIQSDTRKNAVSDLKRYAHPKVKTEESVERTRQALIDLGRRDGIPDWVPPGGSDDFRRGILNRRNAGSARFDYLRAGSASRGGSRKLTASNSNRSRRK